MEKEKMKLMEYHLAPEKKNGAAPPDQTAAKEDTITIVVNSENYQIEIEIYS